MRISCTVWFAMIKWFMLLLIEKDTEKDSHASKATSKNKTIQDSFERRMFYYRVSVSRSGGSADI